MRSVVTGGGGFLGRYIVDELLAAGDEVVSLARGHYAELNRAGVTSVRCDLRDGAEVARALKGADRVFHVAARVGVWGPWREYYDVNVTGTENVIEACRANGVGKLVYTSSPSVVFDGRDHCGVDESYPYPETWLSPYPRSKKLAEEKVLAANGGGLMTVSLRPHLIWGKGDTSLIPRVMDRARRGKLVRVGTGRNKVDIIHVRNAARAHVLAAESAACAGKAYFLSQGKPVVLWEFIGEILDRAGIRPVRKAIPFEVAYRLGAALEAGHRLFAPGREPRMTRFLAHQLAKDHYYDIGAARRDFGYKAWVSVREGLDEMFPS